MTISVRGEAVATWAQQPPFDPYDIWSFTDDSAHLEAYAEIVVTINSVVADTRFLDSQISVSFENAISQGTYD